MENNASLLEWGYLSLNHKGEELCGDHVASAKSEDGALTLVLADGLGSGVIASILSTLTSTMLSRMIEEGIAMEEAVATLVRTLPVAKDRGGVAYCTFDVLRVEKDFSATLYCFDNPEPIVLRKGKARNIEWKSLNLEGKSVAFASFYLDVEDEVTLFTDGAVYAGVGETLNFGWGREEIKEYLEGLWNPLTSAKNRATLLVDHCRLLYNSRPGDDVTALVLTRRKTSPLNIWVGPPQKKEDDEKLLKEFFSLPGPHVVCGGTSATIVAKYLGKEVIGSLDYEDSEVPPTSQIEGVDLVTEGIITLNKVLEILQDYKGKNEFYFEWSFRQDGASRLSRMLIEEATSIHFRVGCAMNPAHQDSPALNIKMKMFVISSLAEELRSLGKEVEVLYY